VTGPTQLPADPALAPHLDEAARLSRNAVLVLALAVVPAAAWLVFAPLSSAVVAAGFVKVDLDRRPVQHAEGGTVREVRVRDGQHVRRGETMLVLGDVAVDTERSRVAARVLAERAGLARLEAEQAAATSIAFPEEVLQAARSDPAIGQQVAKERALFEARRSALSSQVHLLHAQQARIAQEIQAQRAQITQAGESLRHQTDELDTNRRLLKDGFISATRISQLEATIADYRVKLEERRGELSRAEQRLGEADLRIKALESEYRQQASDQSKLTSARLAELQQELRRTADASARQVIVAPADGNVINLRFASPGAVVSPREPIADIVPSNPRLVVEARLRTEDVSRVQLGQTAEVRFTAFKYRSTRLIPGKVTYVSPDRIVDRQANQAYYIALVEADATALAAQGEIKLQAGMPAEVYLRGEDRTALQYLVEPVTQVLRRAGREM
jgi:membrane fusion protein, epimerase transport system